MRPDAIGSVATDSEWQPLNRGKGPTQIPADLLVLHLASTFVLVLDWWIERQDALAPKQVDAVFRALESTILTES